MSSKQDLIRLHRYVNAAADLAESIRNDVQKGSKISNASVVQLGVFFQAARAVAHILTEVQNTNSDIQ